MLKIKLRTRPGIYFYLIQEAILLEYYLSGLDYTYRYILSSFRCSMHNLLIEEGRHKGLTRSDRLCKMCNCKSVENEIHFKIFYQIVQYYLIWGKISYLVFVFQQEQRMKKKGELIGSSILNIFVYLKKLSLFIKEGLAIEVLSL